MTTGMSPTTIGRRLGLLAAASILAAACGGSEPAGDPEVDTPDASVAETETVADGEATDAADEPAPGTEPEPDTDSESEPPSESDTEPVTDTEIEPEPEPVVFDLDSLPDLVAGAIDASDPVATARDVVGLPIDVGVDGATDMVRLDARIVRLEDDGVFVLRHEVGYAAAAAIGDVDIALDDNGAGSVEIIDLYDPVMTELGYRRTASTGSDPGDPGGPNSVNHVYSPEFEELPVNGISATPRNVFIWNDENLLGASESSLDDVIAGRRVDVEFDTADGAVAVPMLAAIAGAVPVPDGAVLTDARIVLHRRSPDSFDIDRGEHYLETRVDFVIESATFDEMVARFAGDDALAPGGDVIGAEPSFFEDGAWEPTEGSEFADLDWRRGVLLIDRYEGDVRVAQDDEGLVTVSARFTLDAIAPMLVPSE